MEFGLLGHPLGHSYSPMLHGLFGDYRYELFDVSEKEFPSILEKKEFKGLNVTIPYKESVIPYLDETDPSVDEIGACNTILNSNGRLIGYNTDYLGLKELIVESGIDVADKTVAILGTGGTSKTAYAVLKSLNAKDIMVVSRTSKPGAITYEDLYDNNESIDVILNATPVGMSPKTDANPLDLSRFPHLIGIIDVVYNPLRTRFVQQAQELGKIGVGGLRMLVGQAYWASRVFQGVDLNPSLLEAAYKSMLRAKQNIVLIGMPSSGKSKLGKTLSKELNMPYIDTDDVFVEKMKMSIADYMSMFGEKNFRRHEKEIVKTFSTSAGTIISTGGGVILDAENVANLKLNGKVFFLDRPLEQLKPSSSRPLSSSVSALEKLYKYRYPLYLKAADVRIEGGFGLDYEVDIIRRDLGL